MTPPHTVEEDNKQTDPDRFVLDHISFKVIPESKSEPFTRHFQKCHNGLVRSEPGGFVLTPEFGSRASEIYQLQPREDDVWILTFPKCGTTWVSEMVWLLTNECNFQEANSRPLSFRTPFLELPYLLSPQQCAAMRPPTVEQIEAMSSPRVLKTHVPIYLLPPKLLDTSKVVYVARNPKDAIVSFFYHHNVFENRQNFSGSVEEFAEYFMKDLVWFAPFFPHVLEAWNKRSHPNMHLIFYEDLKKDLKGEIKRLSDFLGRNVTEDELCKLEDHLTFDNFSKNEAVNFEPTKKIGIMKHDAKFIRKGIIGDWKNHFSFEMCQRIDDWIEKHLAETDLKFITESKC